MASVNLFQELVPLSRLVGRILRTACRLWLDHGPLGSHVTALATRSDFRMDFCDLIVSMEQAEISPRPVVGAIVVVSGLAAVIPAVAAVRASCFG